MSQGGEDYDNNSSDGECAIDFDFVVEDCAIADLKNIGEYPDNTKYGKPSTRLGFIFI